MSNKTEQEDKLHQFLNDRSLLRQNGTTYFQRAQLDAALEHQGRFREVTVATVVGATPPAYPKLPTNNSFACDPVGLEPLIDATDCGPRLGYRIDGHPESLVSLPSDLEMSPSKSSASTAARDAAEITPGLPVEVSAASSSTSRTSRHSSSVRHFSSKPLRRL